MAEKPVFDYTSAQLAAAIAEEKRNIAAARKFAYGTLNPAQMRKAVLKGEIDPIEAVTWGLNKRGTAFTIDDLKGFDRNRARVSGEFGTEQGAPIVKILARCTPEDIQAANRQIGSPNLFKVHSGVAHFSVPSSGDTAGAPPFYGVRIRLDEWTHHLTSYADYRDAVRAAIKGRVSFDCTCGRHQYYLRYVATAANCALRPTEQDYPKINNPKLLGMGCKHIIKALKVIMTPTYQKFLARQMEYQANNIGFSGDTKHKNLSKKAMKELRKARPADVDLAKMQAKAAKLRDVAKTYKSKTKGPTRDEAYVRNLEQAKRKIEQELRKEKAKAAKMAADMKALVEGNKAVSGTSKAALQRALKNEIDGAKRYGGDEDAAIRYFAEQQGITLAKVRAMAKELK